MRTLVAILLFTMAASGVVQQPKWKPFSSPDGSFSVLLPNSPTEQKLTIGDINALMYVSVDDDATEYAVGVSDYPEAIRQLQPDKVFDAGVATMIAAKHGKLINQSAITLEGYAGRAITVEARDGLITTGRLYLVKNRVYQLLAETKRIKENAERIESFLNSFKLAEAKKP